MPAYAESKQKNLDAKSAGSSCLSSTRQASVPQFAAGGQATILQLQAKMNSRSTAMQFRRFQQMADRGPDARRLQQWQNRMDRRDRSCAHAPPGQHECGQALGLVARDRLRRKVEPIQRKAQVKDSGLRTPAERHAAPLQLKIEDDLQRLGLGEVLGLVGKSARARTLIQKANEANVAIVQGGWGGAQTARGSGNGQILVSLPQSRDLLDTAQSLIFELHNALRQDRFDRLSQQARTGEIADEDEYARKKMQIEIEGMVGTGRIGGELRREGVSVPVNKFYASTFLKYAAYSKDNPFASLEEFTRQQADEVLDVPHAQSSHRRVYTEQFRALRNPANASARAENEKQRTLASQVRSMSKMIGREQAVGKLWREETSRVPALFNYLTRQSDSAPNAELRSDLVRGLAPQINAAIGSGVDVEPFIMGNPALMTALYSWIEANDEGQYRNLSQVLGLSLGYYRDHPEHLRASIYPAATDVGR